MTPRFDEYFFTLFSEETFDNLFRNPENNDKKFYDILDKFESGGGKILGTGAFASALSHPKWNYVLKIFHSDDAYLTYARYCFRNQHNPCVPKFLDKPRKIRPNFTRRWIDERDLYYIRMEKLESLGLHSDLYKFYSTFQPYTVVPLVKRYSKEELMNPNFDFNAVKDDLSISEEALSRFTNAIQTLRKNPDKPWLYDYCKILVDVDDMSSRLSGTTDLHEGNIMVRPSDKTLVITDPLAFAYNRNRSKEEVRNAARAAIKSDILILRGGQNRSKNKILKNLKSNTR